MSQEKLEEQKKTARAIIDKAESFCLVAVTPEHEGSQATSFTLAIQEEAGGKRVALSMLKALSDLLPNLLGMREEFSSHVRL